MQRGQRGSDGFVCISKRAATVSINIINCLIFVTGVRCVPWKQRARSNILLLQLRLILWLTQLFSYGCYVSNRVTN